MRSFQENKAPLFRSDLLLLTDVFEFLSAFIPFSKRKYKIFVRGGVIHVRGNIQNLEEQLLLRKILSKIKGVNAIWDVVSIAGKRPRVIDLGCGRKKQFPKALGVDFRPLKGVDVVADLNNTLPFKENSADHIFAIHVLEHLPDLLSLMNEVHRVLKPSGIFHVIVPNSSSKNALADPTHVRFFNKQTFRFFCLPHLGMKNFIPLLYSQDTSNIYIDLIPAKRGRRLNKKEVDYIFRMD